MSGVSQKRYLSVWLRRFSTDRVMRHSPERAERLLVLVGSVKNARVLTAVSDAAARLGLREGLSFADACAIHPGLAWADAEPEEDARLLDRLCQSCERYTPFASVDAPDGLILDIGGCAHLFGGEIDLARDLLARLKTMGFRVRIGIAQSVGCAWAVARHGRTPIVAHGAARAALTSLPVAALRLDPNTITGLRQLGLKTIGDVMARPRAPLAARFGAVLLQRLDQALGRVDEPIAPRLPVAPFSVEQGFAEPCSRDADLLAVLAHLTGRLCVMLEERGRGARKLLASVFAVDGAVRRLEIGTAAPLRDPGRLNRLIAEKFSTTQWQDEFGYDRIRLAALATETLGPTVRDFSAREEGIAYAHLIDRLAARLGSERVLSFIAQDTHVPEDAMVPVPAQSAAEFSPPLKREGRPAKPGGETSRCSRDEFHPSRWRGSLSPFRGEGRLQHPSFLHHDTLALTRPLRLFERPELIEAIAKIPDGPPVRFRWRRLLYQVACAEGPERIAMPWWRDDESRALTRDYFRVESEEGVRLWLYREGLYGRETKNPRWFVHGFLP
jgi:protein ImuB